MTYGVHICCLMDAEGQSPCGKYRWEFHEYLGPTFLTPKTGKVMKNQPVDENWPGWKPFEEWLAKYRGAQQRSDRCLVEPVGGKVGDHPRCAQYPDCPCGGPPADAVQTEPR